MWRKTVQKCSEVVSFSASCHAVKFTLLSAISGLSVGFLQVMAEDPGQRRQRPFEVTIKWVANIDISELLEFIR